MESKRYVLENIRGNVRDVGAGKQPPETVYESVNFVFDKERGSMKSRNGYTTGLTPPSDLASLAFHLTKPVTYPISEDTHLYFYTDAGANKNVALKPFRHTSSAIATTASLGATGWVDVNESLTFTGFSVANMTITGSTTNTIVLTGADTYSFSTTANYYKNWVLQLKDTSLGFQAFFVKSYAYSAAASGTITLTLDQIVDSSTALTFVKADIQGAILYRYFHKDKTDSNGIAPFSPTYTDPDAYSTEVATRWSGGLNSDSGGKNCWTGYLNKIFFKADNTNKVTFTGTYVEQAECFAPTSALLKSLTNTNLSDISLISATNGALNGGAVTTWTSVGNHYINGLQTAAYPAGTVYGGPTSALILSSQGNGDATNNHFILGTGLSIVTATIYTLKLNIAGAISTPVTLNWSIVGATGSNSGSVSIPPTSESLESKIEVNFTTANTTESRTLKLWFSESTPNNIQLYSINVIAQASNRKTLPTASTGRVYASFVYDGFQESDPTYLSGAYINNPLMYFVTILSLGLGTLNKRITAVRLYLSIEAGDTTLQSNTTTYSPKYLVKEVLISDDTTNLWSLNTTTGKFELTVNIDGDLWAKKGLTWEQKTKRVASSSTTCSYSVANVITGRVFVAQYYDYADAKFFTNALRYAGFNGDGVMCPDIFPNIPDFFITYINSGSGNDIKSITEFNRTAIIHKESSMCQLTTAEEQPLWQLRVIDNSTGSLHKWIPEILEDSLVWADANDVYSWSGGSVRSLAEGIWRQYWQSVSTGSTYKSWINFQDKTYNLSIGSRQYFKIKLDGQFSVQQTTHLLITQASTKDGSSYFSSSAGASYLFSTSATDSGTAFGGSFDTGEIAPEPFKMINIDKLFIHNTITGTLAGDLVIVLTVDGTTVKTYTITAPSTVGNYLEIPMPAGTKGHRFRVKFNNGLTFTTTGAISIHRIGIDYHSVMTDGDLSYKV